MLVVRGKVVRLFRSTLARTISASPLLSQPTPQSPDHKANKLKVDLITPQERVNKLRAAIKIDEESEFVVPLFKKSLLYADRVAVKDDVGEYTYLQLYVSAKKLAVQVSNICGSGASMHVACLCTNSALFTLAQWACWISGQVVVPLNTEYPIEMLKFLMQDAKVKLVICTSRYEAESGILAKTQDLPLIVLNHTFLPGPIDSKVYLARFILSANNNIMVEGTLNNDFYTVANALLLYTAGTTRKPKGVLLTHKNLNAQTNSLVDIWQFTNMDHLLHVIPLKHLHGCFSAFLCPLVVGGKIVMHDDFNSHNVWSTMLAINAPLKERVNLFLAIPALYAQLIAEYDKIFAKDSRMVEYIENYCKKNFRLMIAAAAPLPETVSRRWREITGHNLLECYSTTETGIVFSNNCDGNGEQRRSKSVGLPLPGVKVRLMGAESKIIMTGHKPQQTTNESKAANEISAVLPNTAATPSKATAETTESNKTDPKNDSTKRFQGLSKPVGELQVSGPTVFEGYFNRSEDIIAELRDGDYFKTGDIAVYEDGVFQVIGNTNVDIIETEGHKVCSLELESLLITHPSIKDVAVLGIPDSLIGERIGVICVLKPEMSLDLEALKSFCAKLLPTYKHPSAMHIVNDLPRDGRTKLNKFELIKMYFNCKNKL